MNKIESWLNESAYIAPLSPACEMCAQGSKMVLLITGQCSAKCFYCPLSSKKLGKDRIFADEWELDTEKDVDKLIKEAEYIEATGAGITGGDPLIVWKRTKDYIYLLKDTFGEDFHIHLYTSGLKNGEHIDDLISVGLDEIRFHPLPKYWDKMDDKPIAKTIKNSVNTNIDVAIEIPVMPGMENQILSLIRWSDKIGVKWINLNELEFSETNAEKLKNEGFTVKDDISSAVRGSQELANNIIEKISRDDLGIGVHYCSSSFKDGIQLRNRIKRRAQNVAKEHEVITDDGTLLKGVVYSDTFAPMEINILLLHDFGIDERYISVNNDKNRVEIAPWILEKIAPELKKKRLECYIVEEYPTADALEVERIPLPL